MEKQSWMGRLAEWLPLRSHRVLTVVWFTTLFLALFVQTAQAAVLMQGNPPYWDGYGISHHSSPGDASMAPSQDHNFMVYNDPAWSGYYCYSDTTGSANIAAGCNNQISSIYLASGWSVRVYDGQNQSGSSVCFNRSYENLAQHTYSDNAALDNTISSFTLYNTAWCGSSPSPAYPLEVYNDANYAGYWCYSAQAESANIAAGCNDLITSILLRTGWSIRVYEGTNQSGSSQCLNSSDADLRDNFFADGSPMSDAISSFHLYNQAHCGETSPAVPVERPEPPDGGSCPVPFFWQSDPRWANHPLRTGGAGTCSSKCSTIGECGCTLTSATMIFDYYGANTTKYGKTMNPANLSDCLGKYACPFTWYIANGCANNKVSFSYASFSWSRLEQELEKGRLVILFLMRPDGGTHYVVAVSGSGGSAQGYLVNDPALKQGARVKLSAVLARRNYRIVNMRSYAGTPDCQPLDVHSTDALKLALTLSTTTPLTGSVVIYRNTETTMTLELTAQSINGTVKEMLIWTDSISNTIWQPFTEYVALPLSEQFFVRFRDDVGTISEIISNFSDPIEGPTDLFTVFLPLILREQ